MSMRTVASFAVAILLGLIAVVMVRSYLGVRAPGTGAGAAGITRPVVVATGPIGRGARLSEATLKIANYPADAVPAGSFSSVAQALGAAGEKRLAVRNISANEPILPEKVSGAGRKGSLATMLTPGMRAVSIRSTDIAGVAGFVMPGDRVDVLMTRASSATSGYDLIQALGENVLVVGVDQTDTITDGKPVVAKAITLEVTPEQAQSMSLAQTAGQLTLALRQVADNAPLTRRATTLAELGKLEGEVRARVQGPAPSLHSETKVHRERLTFKPSVEQVRVTRGVEVSSYPAVVD